ncbi:relaxase/mobilization nuclease domain-containing protein [Leptolyngbya sp. PL-A3]|uniref:relaxase/mobilization nuclease domain-containing protein n=1 Tax=Leptolyngbya sp. PL-A3 TaxID=2933911 RepID=UPI003299B56C
MPILVHTKPRNVYKALKYAISKPGAIIIAQTLASNAVSALAHEILLVSYLNRDVKRLLYHGKLAVEIGMSLPFEMWEVVIIDLSDGIGYEEHPYILPLHTDQEHEHVHLLWPRLNEEGICICDSWDYYKAQKVLREISKRYGLPELKFSWEVIENAPTFAEVYRADQQQAEYEQGLRDRLPDLSVRQQLLATIKESAADQPRLPEFIQRLQQEGIEVRVDLSRPGISFKLHGVKFRGSSLGRGFSFHGLHKHFGVKYDSEQDDELITSLMERPFAVIETSPELYTPSSNALLELPTDSHHSYEANEGSDVEWETVQTLMAPYQFHLEFIRQLYEDGLIAMSKKKQLAFGTRTLDGSDEGIVGLNANGEFENFDSPGNPQSNFWLARSEQIDRLVIVDNPLEAIATYLMEADSPTVQGAVYLAVSNSEGIPVDWLDEIEVVRLSVTCTQEVQNQVQALVPRSQKIDPGHAEGWVGRWKVQQEEGQREKQILPDLNSSYKAEIEL